MSAFLWEQNQIQNQKPAEKNVKKDIKRTPSKTDQMLQANAPWNPASVFGLVLSFIGLYFAIKGLIGMPGLIAEFLNIQSSSIQVIQHASIKPSIILMLIVEITYIILGLYLIRRPHRLVSFAFPKAD